MDELNFALLGETRKAQIYMNRSTKTEKKRLLI